MVSIKSLKNDEIRNIFINKIKEKNIDYFEFKNNSVNIIVFNIFDASQEYFNRFWEVFTSLEALNYMENVGEVSVNVQKIKDRNYLKLSKVLDIDRKEVFDLINADVIDSHTEKTISPMAEAGRLLKKNFQVSSVFSGVNSKSLIDYLGTSLSVNKIHELVLNNFDGVQYRKQNGGFAYTLRLINVGGLNG